METLTDQISAQSLPYQPEYPVRVEIFGQPLSYDLDQSAECQLHDAVIRRAETYREPFLRSVIRTLTGNQLLTYEKKIAITLSAPWRVM